MKSSPHQNLSDAVDRILSYSLGSNLLRRVPWLHRPANDGPSWNVDWPWMTLLAGAVLTSFILYRESYLSLCRLNLWSVGFIILATPIAYHVKKSILGILREDVFPTMSDASCQRAADRMQNHYSSTRIWKWTAFISASWTSVAAPALAYDLHRQSQFAVGPLFLWLISFTVLISAAKTGCNCTFYYAVCAGCVDEDLDGFPFAPAESPLVCGMERIGNWLIGFMTFTALYLASILLWIRPFPYFVLVTTTICLLASLGLGLVVYTRVSSRLADLISHRRQRSLRELQARLALTMHGERDSFESAHDLFNSMLNQRLSIGVWKAVRGGWPILIQIVTLAVAIWGSWPKSDSPKPAEIPSKTVTSSSSIPAEATDQRP